MQPSQLFLIFVFLLTILAVLLEPVLRVRGKKVLLDYGTSPILAIIVLALAGYVDLDILRDALLGINGLVPWQVLAIFFAGTYICISIDNTGALEYASARIMAKSGGNGRKLYYGLVALTAIFTIFTSNDIVTLTMTPLICYMAKYSKINPIPYLIAVFFASNTWSMVFYIGNPPNIVVAQVFSLRFMEYARLMALPTLAAGLSSTILVYLMFRREIDAQIALDARLTARRRPRRPLAALVYVAVFAILFLMLSISEYIGLGVLQTIAFFAFVFLVLNALFALRLKRRRWRADAHLGRRGRKLWHRYTLAFDLPEFMLAWARIPWKMVPLTFSFFTIIHLFTVHGLTDLLAGALSHLRGPLVGPVSTAFLSAFSANVMINQPMSILFASALQSPRYAIAGAERLANGLALIVGTNLGGNITLFGALAGLMWSRILAYQGIDMNYKRFLSYSIKVMPPTILITALVLAVQMWGR